LKSPTHQDDLGVLLPSRWQPAAAAGIMVEVKTAPLAEPRAAQCLLVGTPKRKDVSGFYARYGFRRVAPASPRMFLPEAPLETGMEIAHG